MNSSGKALEVPGNLLLAGEYAITLEKRRGITFAAGPPVRVHLEPAEHFRLRARFGLRDEAEDRRSPVFTAALNLFADPIRFEEIAARAGTPAAQEATARRSAFDRNSSLPALSITVDSSSLFTPGGRKLGFGSSAAAAVGTIAALLTAVDIDPVADRRLTALLATAAHRDAQNGAGSGYDVATSCFGGIGLFTGGRWPDYERIDPVWLPPLGITSGEFPESTSGAISCFRRALETDETRISGLLDQSDQAVHAFAAAADWQDGRRALERSREVGVEIGRAIGVPAEVLPETVYGENHGICGDRFMKALGAGRETIGLLPYLPDCGDAAVPCDMEGLRWA